ncbi:MAG: hypothetical protein WCL18_02715 [bacterium]
MTNLLDSESFKKLLEANSLRKEVTPKLRELLIKTKKESTVYIKKEFERLLICQQSDIGERPKFEKHANKWPGIQNLEIEISLGHDRYEFCFEIRLHFNGTPGTYMAANTSTLIDKITFDDALLKLGLEDFAHRHTIYFKKTKDFDFLKKIIKEIKIETATIVEALTKN